MSTRPNIVYVFGDQWRAQAHGYAGDPNVKTPHIDRFAGESVNFVNAVSGCPVCTPYRGTLMTGEYPHRHGLVANDQCLYERASGPFLAEVFRDAGYDTAYIGKWHIDGKGRSANVAPERRLGFTWWKGYECSHDYNQDWYYHGDDPERHPWEGYDAFAQSREACRYLREDTGDRPFLLMLSYGPPHNPYQTAPEQYRQLYDPATLQLRPNVPPEAETAARKDLAGYYAHCTALDEAFGWILATLAETGLADHTIVVYTSDHGDMLGSHGEGRKQRPWDESVRTPLLIRDPRGTPRVDTTPIDIVDMMPTLLGLCDIDAPDTLQGLDFSPAIRDGQPVANEAAMLMLYTPFHEWRFDNGGREYRGLRTDQYTYVRTLKDGPWLLYNNLDDPYQDRNRIDDPALAGVRERLDALLQEKLDAIGDPFLPADQIFEQYHLKRDQNGDVFYAR